MSLHNELDHFGILLSQLWVLFVLLQLFVLLETTLVYLRMNSLWDSIEHTYN